MGQTREIHTGIGFGVLNVEVGSPGGWSFIIFEVPSNPGGSMILWSFYLRKCSSDGSL